MRKIGSQYRYTLDDEGYQLEYLEPSACDGPPRRAVLKDNLDRYDLYQENDYFAGAVVEIDGVGFEFIRSLTPEDKYYYGLT